MLAAAQPRPLPHRLLLPPVDPRAVVEDGGAAAGGDAVPPGTQELVRSLAGQGGTLVLGGGQGAWTQEITEVQEEKLQAYRIVGL